MQGLLESILEKTNFDYISDLKGKLKEESVKNALQAIFPERYSVEVWSDAVSYLTRGERKISDMRGVVEFIEKL